MHGQSTPTTSGDSLGWVLLSLPTELEVLKSAGARRISNTPVVKSETYFNRRETNLKHSDHFSLILPRFRIRDDRIKDYVQSNWLLFGQLESVESCWTTLARRRIYKLTISWNLQLVNTIPNFATNDLFVHNAASLGRLTVTHTTRISEENNSFAEKLSTHLKFLVLSSVFDTNKNSTFYRRPQAALLSALAPGIRSEKFFQNFFSRIRLSKKCRQIFFWEVDFSPPRAPVRKPAPGGPTPLIYMDCIPESD